MNPAAPTTYRILLSVLIGGETSQRELARHLEVSVGQTSKVFRWLEENGLVERGLTARRSQRGKRSDVYALTNPTGLLRAIGLFRQMSGLRQFTIAVDEPRKSLLSDMRSHSVVFCLGTALERFSQFYRSDEISFYVTGTSGPYGAESIRRDLDARREGITRVTAYLLDARTHGRRASGETRPDEILARLRKHGFAEKTTKGHFTTKVQTVVDLFCDGKAYAARDLLEELWGVRL